jgi:hypothetical protein
MNVSVRPRVSVSVNAFHTMEASNVLWLMMTVRVSLACYVAEFLTTFESLKLVVWQLQVLQDNFTQQQRQQQLVPTIGGASAAAGC